MDPTHRGDTTPCRLACQSVYHLFTYNMFHICFANIASGVLVQLCVKWMWFLCEHLNRKPKEQENEHLWQNICVGMRNQVCRAGKRTHIFILSIFTLHNMGLKFRSCQMTFCTQVKKQMIIGTLKRHRNLSCQFQIWTFTWWSQISCPHFKNCCWMFQQMQLCVSQAT